MTNDRWGTARAVGVVGALVMLAVACQPTPPPPTGLPQGFHTEVLASGFTYPTTFVNVGSDRTYVAEKGGTVRVVRNGAVQPTPVIDLSAKVNTAGDRGLNGMAIDPDFAHNGYLYLSYVYKDPALVPDDWDQTQRITRVTVTNDVADPASEVVILGAVTGAACDQHPTVANCLALNSISHTLDALEFAPDGSLLVSVGDGADFPGGSSLNQRAQDVNTLEGKLLRIDRATGHGLPGNPFYVAADPGANRSLVYAYGFRNPYRFSIQPTNGHIFVGDVGEGTWEELDTIQPGANYGWPCFEGPDRFSEAPDQSFCTAMWAQVDQGHVVVTPPLTTYHHTSSGGAIIAGAFVAGPAYPAAYRGSYFFGDYAQPFIRRATIDASDALVGDPIGFADATGSGAPVQLRQGPDGNLWVLSLIPGELRRIVYDGTSTVPSSCPVGQFRVEYFNNVTLTGTPANVRCEATIDKHLGDGSPAPGVVVHGWSFRATQQMDAAGGTYQFSSQAADGARLQVDGTTVIDRWTDADWPVTDTATVRLAAGLHPVVMEYYDNAGDATAVLTSVRTGTPPVVTITSPARGIRIDPGATLPFTVTATDAEDGQLPDSSVVVSATMLHFTSQYHSHTHPYGTRTGATGSFTYYDTHGPNSVMFLLQAQATDSSGITTTSDAVPVCLTSSYVGLCS